jgi:hypothetical protein
MPARPTTLSTGQSQWFRHQVPSIYPWLRPRQETIQFQDQISRNLAASVLIGLDQKATGGGETIGTSHPILSPYNGREKTGNSRTRKPFRKTCLSGAYLFQGRIQDFVKGRGARVQTVMYQGILNTALRYLQMAIGTISEDLNHWRLDKALHWRQKI